MEAAAIIALADLAFRAFELAMEQAKKAGATPEQLAQQRAEKVARFDAALAAVEAAEPPPVRPE